MARVRRLAVLAAALAAAFTVAPPAPAALVPLSQRLDKALSVPRVSRVSTGALAVDLATARTVFSHNSSRALAPASNEKLPLAFALLSTLGPAFRIETDVLGEGQQQGAVWQGRLVLKGYGDPTLSTADLRRLALQVRAAGIRRVTGGVAGDESWFDSFRTVRGWKPSFYIDESPPLSALVVDRDRIHGVVHPNPPLGAATVFREQLVSAGVAVAGAATVRKADALALPLAAIRSPTLFTLVRTMDRESDNFFAEVLLKELGAVQLSRGTSAAGASVVASALADAGISLAGVRIVDGSGLSLLDRLTASALVGTLEAAWTNPDVRPGLVGSLAVAGVNGTLEDRMRRPPARGRVLAKTGTTNRASALSGYVRGRYAFAVVQNGFPISSYWARIAQDRFATALVLG
jgi:D-alanyl-D-alanine carboxypeptidase/D-alanyl-D-alanine-endopeptidase (penicillin-binding protein 4)